MKIITIHILCMGFATVTPLLQLPIGNDIQNDESPTDVFFHSCSLIPARKGFLCWCKTIMLNVKHNKMWRNRKPLLSKVYALVYTKTLRPSQCSARGSGEHCTQTASVPYPAQTVCWNCGIG